MKKSVSIGFVALLLVSGCGAIAIADGDKNQLESVDVVSFSAVQIHEENGYTCVDLSEETSHLSTPGSYAVPVVTRVYTFPFRTKIIDVSVCFSELQEYHVSKPIQQAVLPIADEGSELIATPVVSSVDTEQLWGYHVAAGRSGNDVVTYLAIHLYPVQYLSSENKLLCARNAEITIQYRLPEEKPAAATEQYELVIISPKSFATALQPLVEHKISNGLTTKLVILDEINDDTYFPLEGRDCPEELKYFIKNTFDQWNTTYVLLVGGRYGGIQQETWWVPARYSSLNDGGEGSYLTDLYFGDLYDGEGNFSSWDSNGNGIFAEWSQTKKDVLDMYPEVYVGRLPCTNTRQVKLMVEKIITYETTTYESEWFKRFVGVAGDTYPGVNDPYYEGELATNASFNQLDDLGFDANFVWSSNGKFTDADSVMAEISKGCGFVHFSGHGNPLVWGNHPPRNESFLYGPNAFEMKELSNGEQQPIVIVGGCHNAQYNTSVVNIISGFLEDGFHYFQSKQPYGAFWYYEWIPRCWAWSMASQSKGGCIGIIANTGLGYGEPGENTLTQRGRHLEWLFFKSYRDGHDMLGETHAYDLMYYMNEHPPMDDQVDCKIIQEWGLLGDPSLKIGGYPS
jgi:hypothetical protein